MLSGMAFENLIKGIDIAADASLVANGKLDMSRWKIRGGHDLSDWARKETLSPDKINLLARLEEFSVWAGRYPIPTNAKTYISSKLPDSKHSLRYADFNLIDELFSELAEKLESVWRVNGALRW
jgi:hypothetical protein